MADFLTRLITRHRGLQPHSGRVEPLIAPMYAAPEARSFEEVSEVRAAESTAPRAVDQSVELRPEAPRATQSAATQLSRVAEMTPGESSAPTAQPLADTHERQDAGAVEPPAVIAATLAATPERTATHGSNEPRTTEIAVPQVPQPTEPRSGVRPDFIGSMQPAAAMPAHRAGSINATLDSPASLPLTKVTIGRIDVRAVHTPATPTPRATPQRPKLSLDDYLRRRNGRRE